MLENFGHLIPPPQQPPAEIEIVAETVSQSLADARSGPDTKSLAEQAQLQQQVSDDKSQKPRSSVSGQAGLSAQGGGIASGVTSPGLTSPVERSQTMGAGGGAQPALRQRTFEKSRLEQRSNEKGGQGRPRASGDGLSVKRESGMSTQKKVTKNRSRMAATGGGSAL